MAIKDIEKRIMENLPKAPEMEYRRRMDANGTEIIELTPDSELAYSRWLTACNMARQVIYKEMTDGPNNGS